jgi:hypothetical protein
MKTTSLVAVVFALALSHTAEARHRSFGGGGSDYDSNGQFGLGLELGEPTGLNGKLFLNPSGALDFGIGEVYHYYYGGDGLHLYLDYLWHPKQLVATPDFKMPFYIGVGGRIWFFDYGPGPDRGVEAFGVRVPIGIDFDLNNVPLDFFAEFVPTLDFFSHNYAPHTVYLDIDFSVGIRFWFS